METKFRLKFSILINVMILTSSLIITSCMPQAPSSKRSVGVQNIGSGGSAGGTGGTGSGAVADGTSTDASSISSQKVELSHLVDPISGSYKKKITIPKNYRGYLYIAGLNLSVLNSRILKVRLNFGVDRQSITMGATLAKAPGITPKTDIQVLVLDMTKRPFQDMRLPYDLFDYNEYNADASLEPVIDPFDGGLYCRGVRLSDDPTYIVQSDTSACKNAGDKCLYTYAKISDAGYYTGSLTTTPTKPAVWGSSSLFNSSLVSGMCLPDSMTTYSNLFTSVIPAGVTYEGPYRAINQNAWGLSEAAIFGSVTSGLVTTYNGLFETGNYLSQATWYKSLMFPRAGKMELNSNVNYIGSTSRFSTREMKVSNSTGYSSYVDGCSIRALNYDSSTNEGIGSCNVLANIEVFYMNGTSEVSITSSNALKIQLTKASILNSEGKQVLSSSFKSCESSSSCGSEECCYNSRCWSKELVSQCVDDVSSTGNREIGTSCTSDFQCASLCCDSSRGSCSPHNPIGTTPVLCSKSAGQACVTSEFCAKEYVPVCKLYKNGLNQDGTVRCQVRCPTVATYGTCYGGNCVAPVGSTDTSSFDLVKCTGAIDP